MPVTLSDAQLAAVQSEVRLHLKDPESARFRGIKARKDKVLTYACGYFNAKNSFGGYNGFKPFRIVLLRETAVIPTVAGDESEAELVFELCRGDGIRF